MVRVLFTILIAMIVTGSLWTSHTYMEGPGKHCSQGCVESKHYWAPWGSIIKMCHFEYVQEKVSQSCRSKLGVTLPGIGFVHPGIQFYIKGLALFALFFALLLLVRSCLWSINDSNNSSEARSR